MLNLLLDTNKKEEKEITLTQMLLRVCFVTFPFICFCKWMWPTSIPFDLFQFWDWNIPTIINGVKAGMPIFIWAFCIQAVFTFFHEFDSDESRNPEQFLIGGFLVSARAGIVEEIIFRWILFLDAFIGLQVVNFLFFGFLHWLFGSWFAWTELPRLFSWYITNPLADLGTFHYYRDFLIEKGWLLGAAVLSANATFRDGHKYLGFFGFVNSWYIGIFLFYIMFEYGLVSAILVHFAYDMIIYWVIFLHAYFRGQS